MANNSIHPGKAPRWIKVMAVGAAVLALVFVVLHLTGVVSMGGHLG